MTFIVIGIDGGGSKTHAIVADELGRTITEAVGPGSAVRPGKAEDSANVIAEVVRDALASCGMTHVTPRVLCVNLQADELNDVAHRGVFVIDGLRRGSGACNVSR